MRRKLIQWLGMAGVLALLSYTAAVVFSPLAYPGYNCLAQAVSDLSADSAPSRGLWNRLAALYGVGSVVCATSAAVFVSERKISSRLFRTGIYLFAGMNWVSDVGYAMFPLVDSGKEITSFQEFMHVVVTALVVVLSIASLVCIGVNGIRGRNAAGVGKWAAIALFMMMVGAIGQGIVPQEYFGVVERFSVFAVVGFNAMLGWYLFNGFRGLEGRDEVVHG